MAEEWFYSRNKEQIGPVTIETLRQLAASGQLQQSDMVWRQGMENWVAASAAGGIFATPAAPAHLAYAQPVPMPRSMVALGNISDAHALMRYEANKKSLLVAYILWWLLGGFGAHRFYLGRTGSGVAILVITVVSIPLMFVGIGFITILVSGIWAFVDVFLIPGICREFNNGLANSLAGPGFAAQLR